MQMDSTIFLDKYCQRIDWRKMLNRWAAAPDFLAFVGQFIFERKPKVIVECSSGLSTLVIASCLKEREAETLFISLEHKYDYYKKINVLLREYELSKYTSVYYAPLTEFRIGNQCWNWYDWEHFGSSPIELVVIDGPPGHTAPMARYPVLPLLWGKLSDDAILLLDDGKRQDERFIVQRWEQEFDVTSELLPHERGTFVLRLS